MTFYTTGFSDLPAGWYVLDDTTHNWVSNWKGKPKAFRTKRAAERRADAIEFIRGHRTVVRGHRV